VQKVGFICKIIQGYTVNKTQKYFMYFPWPLLEKGPLISTFCLLFTRLFPKRN